MTATLNSALHDVILAAFFFFHSIVNSKKRRYEKVYLKFNNSCGIF